MKKTYFWALWCLSQTTFANSSWYEQCHLKTCDVVVDVGYTGVRVHVYAYDAKNFKKQKSIHQIYFKKISRSLSHIPIADVNKTLDILFADFPKIFFNTYVYATESYRSLPLHEEIAYSKETRNWFKRQKYLKLIEMRKISGDEEAAYAWISNDYVLGHPPYQTGIIEIGGGSAQIAVNVQSGSNTIQFSGFDEEKTSIWTQSFNQYGREKIASRVSCQSPIDMDVCIRELRTTCQSLNVEEQNLTDDFIKHVSPSIVWYGLGLLNHLGQSPLMELQSKPYYLLGRLLKQGNEKACRLSISSLKEKDIYADKACFNMAYSYTFLHGILGMSTNTKIHYYRHTQGHGWPEGILIWRLLKV